MKILVISNMYPDNKFPFYGTFVKNFCEQLKEINIKYDLAVMNKSNSKIDKIIKYILFFLETFFKITFKKYEIIYVHYASISSIPVLFARKFKKNLIIYTNVHGSDVVPENKKQEKNHKNTEKILKVSNRIIVPSLYFKNLVIEKYNINPSEIFVYPSGGINPQIFYPLSNSKDDLKKSLGLSLEKKYIGFVSRISKDKGWDTFCKAMELFFKENKEYEAIIVGSGSESKELQILLKKLKISERVVLHPALSQKELNIIYNVIDCLVFSSRREGESLGLIPLEAMAAGTCVIVNNFAAPGEYIIDGFNGFKFDSTYQNLFEKLSSLCGMSDSSREKIISNAQLTIQNYYSTNCCCLLKEVIEK